MKWKYNNKQVFVYSIKPNYVEFKYGILTMVSVIFLRSSPFIEEAWRYENRALIFD